MKHHIPGVTVCGVETKIPVIKTDAIVKAWDNPSGKNQKPLVDVRRYDLTTDHIGQWICFFVDKIATSKAATMAGIGVNQRDALLNGMNNHPEILAARAADILNGILIIMAVRIIAGYSDDCSIKISRTK